MRPNPRLASALHALSQSEAGVAASRAALLGGAEVLQLAAAVLLPVAESLMFSNYTEGCTRD